MGGISVILCGAVVIIGTNSLIQVQNLLLPRNIAIVGAILILRVGGMSISAGSFALEGIGLSSIVGVLLNLLLPQGKNYSS